MSLITERPQLDSAFTEPLFKRTAGNFTVRDQFAEKHVVIPDLHGESELLEKVLDIYDDSDTGFVFLGDLIDQKGVVDTTEKGVRSTLEIIKQMGNKAVVTLANHEWYLLAAMGSDDPLVRTEVSRQWLGTSPSNSIEHNVLNSYDMDPSRRDDNTIPELQRRMKKIGHLSVLTAAVPYYETPDFIATHAGIMPGVPWEIQRSYLHDVSQEMDEGLFYDRPPQWFSFKLATNADPNFHTDKVIVSGHAHSLNGSGKKQARHTTERSLFRGKRVRLASRLNAPHRDPLYIWQDWDKQIVTVPQAVND